MEVRNAVWKHRQLFQEQSLCSTHGRRRLKGVAEDKSTRVE